MKPSDLRIGTARRSLAAALAAVLLCPPPALSAGSKPTLVVPPLGPGGSIAARSALAAALLGTGRAFVVEPEAVDRRLAERKGDVPTAPSGLAGAREKLRQGKEAFEALKIDEALEAFSGVKRRVREGLSEPGAFPVLWAAHMELARAFLSKRDIARAREELRAFVVIDPERETRTLSAAIYSPDLREAYETARSEILGGHRGDLEITTHPRGALAYVDGKAVGATPTRARGLPVGEHFLRIELEGTEPYFAPIVVTEGERRINVELRPVEAGDVDKYFRPASGAKDITHQRVRFLDELGLSLGSDIFVFVDTGQASVSAQLYDQRTQEVSALEEDSTPEGLAVRLVRHLDRDGYVIPRSDLPPPAPSPAAPKAPLLSQASSAAGPLSEQVSAPAQPARKDLRPWYGNTWVWVGVGALLVGTLGGLYLFTDVFRGPPTLSPLVIEIP